MSASDSAVHVNVSRHHVSRRSVCVSNGVPALPSPFVVAAPTTKTPTPRHPPPRLCRA